MLIETEGMVLRQSKTSDSKRIAVVLTGKYGKIDVTVSSIYEGKKNKSSVAIKPFVLGKYEIYKNRGFYNYSSGETSKSFFELAENIDKYVEASYVLELTDKVTEYEVSQPKLFRLLKDYFFALEKRKKAYDTLLIAYEIKLLDILGICPRTKGCSICDSEESSYFSIKEGGMICSNCHNKLIQKMEKNPYDGNDLLIYYPKFDIINVVEFFRKKPFDSFEKIELEPGVATELRGMIKTYLSYHLGIGQLKSEGILRDITGGNHGNNIGKN